MPIAASAPFHPPQGQGGGAVVELEPGPVFSQRIELERTASQTLGAANADTVFRPDNFISHGEGATALGAAGAQFDWVQTSQTTGNADGVFTLVEAGHFNIGCHAQIAQSSFVHMDVQRQVAGSGPWINLHGAQRTVRISADSGVGLYEAENLTAGDRIRFVISSSTTAATLTGGGFYVERLLAIGGKGDRGDTAPLPAGGAAGATLRKASAADYDVEWAAAHQRAGCRNADGSLTVFVRLYWRAVGD